MQVALKSSEKFASSIQVRRLSLPQRDCIVFESDVLSQMIVLFQLYCLHLLYELKGFILVLFQTFSFKSFTKMRLRKFFKNFSYLLRQDMSCVSLIGLHQVVE